MLIVPVLTQTAILFILILIGFIIKKLNIISDSFVKELSGFIVNVTLPMMIISSMNYDFSTEMLMNSLLILFAGAISYIVVIIISNIFTHIFKANEPQKGVYKFLILLSNTGFMGFPILNAMYGSVGIFYGSIFNILFNIVLWTIGVHLVSNTQRQDKGEFKNNIGIVFKKLINPGIVSIIIGFVLFLSPIKLPILIYSPIKLIGDSTTPLAMMVVGALLADVSIGGMFKNYKLYAVSAVRLVIIPIVLVLIFPLLKLPDIVAGVVVLVNSMPAAANVAIFAKKYNSDYELASQGVFITTLLNLFTVPLIIYLITFQI